MINIVELEKPKLKKIKMNCDQVIDPKLLKYQMIRECWSTTSCNCILGLMGQGKTSLITSLMKNKEIFNRTFHNVYVFIPDGSRMSIEDDIYGKGIPEDQLFDDLNESNLNFVFETLKENRKNEEFSIIIIDDYQERFKDPDIVALLEKIVNKHRHLFTTIFFLQQNFQALHKRIREKISNIICFNVGKEQLSQIFDQKLKLKKSIFEELIDVSFQDEHDWILINTKKNKFYRNFDEIIISK